MATNRPLVVIVGPTASGKSDLAMKIAREYDGEIICADSRTVYKDMDIGTAKPSQSDRKDIQHHLLDVAKPGERFTVADFQCLANQVITDIISRKKLPILVGGTGLYVDSVLFGYKFTVDHDPKRRKELESMKLEELHQYCKINNITLPQNKLNKRHVVRNIERNGHVVRSKKVPINTSIIVGISTDKITIHNRIVKRTEHIFESGVVNEAKLLGKMYGWDSEAMTGNIYPILLKYLNGEISLEQAKSDFIKSDVKLAKRQMTWFKRNKYIHWLELEKAYTFLAQSLDKIEQK